MMRFVKILIKKITQKISQVNMGWLVKTKQTHNYRKTPKYLILFIHVCWKYKSNNSIYTSPKSES